MEIKFHLTVDKDKDLQFQCEVRPPVRIWDLEIDKEDHHPTPDRYQSQTPVYLGSVVAKKDLEWGAVAVYKAREDWSYHPEKKIVMDWPHFEEACHQHHLPVPWVESSRGYDKGQTEAGIWGLGDDIKIGSDGRLWWKPYALVGVKRIKSSLNPTAKTLKSSVLKLSI